MQSLAAIPEFQRENPEYERENVAKILPGFLINPVTLVVFALLIASSNIGLINRHAALQSDTGSNLLGIRDVSVALVLTFGLMVYKLRFKNRFTNIILMIVALTPLAALLGLANEAPMAAVLIDGVNMFSWLIAIVVAQHFRTAERLHVLQFAITVVGILVALGVFYEAMTGIAVVTPDLKDVLTNKRSTPSGYVTMMLAYSIIFASLMSKANASPIKQTFLVGMIGVIVWATLLTQSRTMMVGMVVSSLVFVGASLFVESKNVRWVYVFLIVSVCAMVVFAILSLGNSIFRQGFDRYFLDRLSIKSFQIEIAEGQRYNEVRKIISEHLAESPIFGKGLGTYYFGEYRRATAIVHSSIGFWLLRYGIIGGLIWTYFVIQIFSSMNAALRDASTDAGYGRGFALGMLNLVVCAFAGNIFGVTYGVQQAMIGLGCLMGYQAISAAKKAVEPKWSMPPIH
jgi:O-Antigen ligase